eukprot:2198785-Pyramimonas_sp.AAC.1
MPEDFGPRKRHRRRRRRCRRRLPSGSAAPAVKPSQYTGTAVDICATCCRTQFDRVPSPGLNA